MGKAKGIIVKPISPADANAIVKRVHYSGSTTQNSQLHFGVFLNGKCGGALQFGPSLDKRKVQGLVSGTQWNEFIELNRMALEDWLPKNGESRVIGYCMRFIKKKYPWIKWVISFSDATQCGDGIIYRASGFVLTGITKNSTIMQFPNGEKVTNLSIKLSPKAQMKHLGMIMNGEKALREAKRRGAKKLQGFQLRYIYFLNPECKSNLTVPIIPFSKIDEVGAGMYMGKSLSAQNIDGDVSGFQPEKGGSSPTCALQLS